MIGLIFGETDFPKQILKKIRNKHRYLIIDLTKKKFFRRDKNSYSVPIGKFGKIIEILKKNKCKKVLFAGKVERPNFNNFRLDLKGVYYLPRIIKSSKIGDAAILKEIIMILKKEKINTVSSIYFNPELSLKKGNYTKLKPNSEDKKDIDIAVSELKKLNKYSFSQATVVRNSRVIATEGKGGTEKMLKNCKRLINKKAGVLVKFAKKGQDLRIDLPTVGLNTFYQCRSAGLKGIVLKSKQNIFLERKKCINFANKSKMFIIVK